MTGGCIWSLIPFPILLALWYAIREPITTMMGIAKDLYESAIVPIAQGITGIETTSSYAQISYAQAIHDNPTAFEGISDKLRSITFHSFGLNLGITPQWNFLFSSTARAEFLAASGVSWGVGFVTFLLPIISAGISFATAYYTQKKNPTVVDPDNPQSRGMGKTMLLMGPAISLWWGFVMPAAITVYWTVSNLFQFVQDLILTKYYTKKLDAEDAVRNAAKIKREEELERKRLETEKLRLEGKLPDVNKNTSKAKQREMEKREREEKRAEWEKKQGLIAEVEEPSREGVRKFARGRAYDPERFDREIAEAFSNDADDDTSGDDTDEDSSLVVELSGDDIHEIDAEIDVNDAETETADDFYKKSMQELNDSLKDIDDK